MHHWRSKPVDLKQRRKPHTMCFKNIKQPKKRLQTLRQTLVKDKSTWLIPFTFYLGGSNSFREKFKERNKLLCSIEGIYLSTNMLDINRSTLKTFYLLYLSGRK